MKRIVCALLCVLLAGLSACRATPPEAEPAPSKTPSSDNAVFVKAVWIPFMEVEMLLGADDPEAAIAAMLDDCVLRGANTVFFHVRANSDAYYDSAVFAPHATAQTLLSQGIDPLHVAVKEAHARGLSLHAWVNPYRIGADAARARCEDTFFWSGKYYYVPSSDTAKALIVSGVRELVENYGIDGVQFDDYFYPKGAVLADAPAEFEREAYTAYQSGGGKLAVGDWRRLQVSSLVADVYAVCHTRTGCVFGISPAYDIADNRDSLYADVREWAKTAGYVDYLCPQLYFGFSHEYAPFAAILQNWSVLDRHPSVSLYAGLALYKTGLTEDVYAGSGKGEWAAGGDILARQMALVSAASWDGAALYSHQSFAADSGRDQTVVQNESEAVCAAWRAL